VVNDYFHDIVVACFQNENSSDVLVQNPFTKTKSSRLLQPQTCKWKPKIVQDNECLLQPIVN